MVADQMEAVIGIPTFRRLTTLRVLLDSIAAEVPRDRVHVVVADNDAGSDVPQLVATWSAQHDVSASCVPVRERGISHTRNALVTAALATPGAWRWLIMVDDDGRVTPGWWEALIGTADRLRVDALAGAVRGELPPGAGRIARNSLFGATPPQPTGRVDMLLGAQNSCFARTLFERLEGPWFDPTLGRTGGEDTELFRRIAAIGGTFGWCEEAVVIEPAPADRLTASAIYGRAFRNGIVGAQIDARHLGPGTTWRRAGGKLAETGLRMAKGTLLGRQDRVIKASIEFSHNAGRVAGLLGARRTAAYGGEAVPAPAPSHAATPVAATSSTPTPVTPTPVTPTPVTPMPATPMPAGAPATATTAADHHEERVPTPVG